MNLETSLRHTSMIGSLLPRYPSPLIPLQTHSGIPLPFLSAKHSVSLCLLSKVLQRKSSHTRKPSFTKCSEREYTEKLQKTYKHNSTKLEDDEILWLISIFRIPNQTTSQWPISLQIMIYRGNSILKRPRR